MLVQREKEDEMGHHDIDEEGITELEDLNLQSGKLAETYRRIFYKVDPALVFDLVTRLQQDPINPKIRKEIW